MSTESEVKTDDFVPYGPEWGKEMTKWSKLDLISFLRDTIKARTNEVDFWRSGHKGEMARNIELASENSELKKENERLREALEKLYDAYALDTLIGADTFLAIGQMLNPKQS